MDSFQEKTLKAVISEQYNKIDTLEAENKRLREALEGLASSIRARHQAGIEYPLGILIDVDRAYEALKGGE